MKFLILLSLIIFTAESVESQTKTIDPEWTFITNGKESKYSVHNKIKKRNSDGSIQIWIKVNHNEFIYENISYKNAFEKSLFYFDCEEQLFDLMQTVMYSSNGSVIYNENFEDRMSPQPVVPGTVVDKVTNFICKKFNY